MALHLSGGSGALDLIEAGKPNQPTTCRPFDVGFSGASPLEALGASLGRVRLGTPIRARPKDLQTFLHGLIGVLPSAGIGVRMAFS